MKKLTEMGLSPGYDQLEAQDGMHTGQLKFTVNKSNKPDKREDHFFIGMSIKTNEALLNAGLFWYKGSDPSDQYDFLDMFVSNIRKVFDKDVANDFLTILEKEMVEENEKYFLKNHKSVTDRLNQLFAGRTFNVEIKTVKGFKGIKSAVEVKQTQDSFPSVQDIDDEF